MPPEKPLTLRQMVESRAVGASARTLLALPRVSGVKPLRRAAELELAQERLRSAVLGCGVSHEYRLIAEEIGRRTAAFAGRGYLDPQRRAVASVTSDIVEGLIG